MSPPPSPRQHLVAGLVLLAHMVFFLLGTPGIDALGPKALKGEAQRAKIERSWGPTATGIAVAVAKINREWRLPLVRPFGKIERLFRIKQAWHLYGGAPAKVRRLEIHVDDRLVYRSRDPEHGWRARQLENRRLRPTVKTLATKPAAFNWKGLGRFIVNHAREDFPGARQVRITGTITPPGGTAIRTAHGKEARAPDWELRPIDESELGDPP